MQPRRDAVMLHQEEHIPGAEARVEQRAGAGAELVVEVLLVVVGVAQARCEPVQPRLQPVVRRGVPAKEGDGRRGVPRVEALRAPHHFPDEVVPGRAIDLLVWHRQTPSDTYKSRLGRLPEAFGKDTPAWAPSRNTASRCKSWNSICRGFNRHET